MAVWCCHVVHSSIARLHSKPLHSNPVVTMSPPTRSMSLLTPPTWDFHRWLTCLNGAAVQLTNSLLQGPHQKKNANGPAKNANGHGQEYGESDAWCACMLEQEPFGKLRGNRFERRPYQFSHIPLQNRFKVFEVHSTATPGKAPQQSAPHQQKKTRR